MWQNLAAGVLSFPTTTSPAKNIEQRLSLLRAALQELVVYRTEQMAANPGQMWQNYTGRPSMVFVAPEYMFLSDGFDLSTDADLSRNRFMEARDWNRVVTDLRGISSCYGKQLVFVPGSIASRRPISGDSANAMKSIISAGQHVRKGADYLQGNLLGLNKADRFNTPDAGQLKGRNARTPVNKLWMLNGMIARNQAGQDCYLANNVACMFHNGRLIAQYAKRADFHEVLPEYAADDTVFIPGIKSGRATVGGINLGIEICLDQAYGALVHAPQITGDLPRIHMVCSAAVQVNKDKVLVREGGYVLHASSNSNWSFILRKLAGQYHNAVNEKRIALGTGQLMMGVLELDIPGI